MPDSLPDRIASAIATFWQVRTAQGVRQGRTGARRDAGKRAVVTGGQQLNGFAALTRDLICEAGLAAEAVHVGGRNGILPGYFRPTKDWDLIAVSNGSLIATMEFKSQIGPSFGNNFNNRTEEAVGSAHDLHVAFREGAFRPSPAPWLGYVMVVEKCDGSTRPVQAREPHFPVFEDLRGLSYIDRYRALCRRLVRERLYSAACLLLTDRDRGPDGYFEEPEEEISFSRLAASLSGHVHGICKLLP